LQIEAEQAGTTYNRNRTDAATSVNTPKSSEVTNLLKAMSSGDRSALDRLTTLLYDELRFLAHRYMRRERDGHTLQTTGLVNEAFVRLVDVKGIDFQDRAHFLAVSARIMRRILVEAARARASTKRGGGLARVEPPEGVDLDALPVTRLDRATELCALDDALEALSRIDPRRAQVIELRFFGGLSVEETAGALNVSRQTVMRDWKLARAWLSRELRR